MLIIDKKDLSMGEAFRESARITDGVKWKLFGFFLATVFLNIVGALCLVLGLLVSIPVSMLAYVHLYRKLSSVQG